MTHSSIQLVIFPYKEISSHDLELVGMRVIPSFLKKVAKNENRLRSYYAGRCTLLELLGEQFKVCPNAEYGFLEVYNAAGEKDPSKFVNLSHTENIAVAVLANHSVGIDIESSKRSAKKVMSRVATETENKWILENPSVLIQDKKIPTDIFLWSSKEAFSKALGLGMKFGFKGFEIQKSLKSPFAGKTEIKGPLTVSNPSIQTEIFDDFLISICSEQTSAGIHRRILTRSRFETLRNEGK